MNVEVLDPENRADVAGVAALHRQELADSPVAQFGMRFLRDFYYRTLVADGLIHCTIGKADGRVVGFISYTTTPTTFMGEGLRRHFVRLAWILVRSVVARPRLVRDILGVLRIMRERSREEEPGSVSESVGEVLSLVSLKPYQKQIPEGGKSRLTVRLFEEMVAFFRSHRIEQIHLLVKPENKASNLFCSIMGCRLGKIVQGGRPVHRYTYTIPEVEAPEEEARA